MCLQARSLALELFDKYVTLPSAPNVHYGTSTLYTGLMQLSMNGGYAESTMDDLALKYGLDSLRKGVPLQAEEAGPCRVGFEVEGGQRRRPLDGVQARTARQARRLRRRLHQGPLLRGVQQVCDEEQAREGGGRIASTSTPPYPSSRTASGSASTRYRSHSWTSRQTW